MTVQITILGLEQIGASFGLALASHKDQFYRLGTDYSMETTRKAEKMGAVDRTVINIPSAVEKADIVLLALTFDELRPTLELIATELKEGAVVIDTSPVKAAVQSWAKELLPAGRYFVAMTPTINPDYLDNPDTSVEAARADLFQKSVMLITCPPGSNDDAIKLAADLAALVGATPLFADPLEVDGLAAAVHFLPRLAASALLLATIDEPGWRESRKLAGSDYAAATRLAVQADEDKKLGQAALLNRTNIMRMLDNLISALRSLRELLASEDAEGLQKLLEHARQGRLLWFKQRHANDWDSGTRSEIPTTGQILSGMLFGQRRPRERK